MAVTYHFKCTVMLDTQNTDFNVARESDTPAPQFQRVLHSHGFLILPYPPQNHADVQKMEQIIMNEGLAVARVNFRLEDEVCTNAIVIIDSVSQVAEWIDTTEGEH